MEEERVVGEGNKTDRPDRPDRERWNGVKCNGGRRSQGAWDTQPVLRELYIVYFDL